MEELLELLESGKIGDDELLILKEIEEAELLLFEQAAIEKQMKEVRWNYGW